MVISAITYCDVRHGSKIVNFMGFNFRDNVEKVRGIAKITIVKE
jgi:hypothetical protein